MRFGELLSECESAVASGHLAQLLALGCQWCRNSVTKGQRDGIDSRQPAASCTLIFNDSSPIFFFYSNHFKFFFHILLFLSLRFFLFYSSFMSRDYKVTQKPSNIMNKHLASGHSVLTTVQRL